MRRSDKVLGSDVAKQILAAGEYGVLSTVDADGQPYGIPLNYYFIGNGIYFHCALEGHKLDNLLANERVSFCVVGRTKLFPAVFSTEYESVIVTGTASVVQGSEKHRGLVGLLEKYSAEYLDEGRKYIEKLDHQTAVVRIEIMSMTGKANVES